MLVHPNIDPIAISFGPVAVRWYGLMYLLGFATAWWLGLRRIGRGLAPVDRKQFDDLVFLAVLGVILGGRLGYVLFYKPGYYASHPLEIFAVWQGGMSFHGGLLGVMLALGFAAWRHRWQPGHVHRLAAGAIEDLMPAARAVRDEHRLRGITHRGQQAQFGHLHRHLGVLGLVTEASRHATATRLHRLHLQAGHHSQHLLHRRHPVERLLVAMSVEQHFLLELAEAQ